MDDVALEFHRMSFFNYFHCELLQVMPEIGSYSNRKSPFAIKSISSIVLLWQHCTKFLLETISIYYHTNHLIGQLSKQGMQTKFPQCNFSLEFLEILTKIIYAIIDCLIVWDFQNNALQGYSLTCLIGPKYQKRKPQDF